MGQFPLPLADLLGHWWAYGVPLIIGLVFGISLEMAGFGNSTKLAAQFYFKDLTVFKVMFTAIIVAMSLIFLATGIGILDYNLIWVPPTYLWPGITGGLIMGVGFIIGGFCPGTSLVAMATLKVDGLFFVLGVLFGIFAFGETVSTFELFFNSSYMGRFTLPELFNIDYGTMILVIVTGALLMFWGAEKIELRLGNKSARKAPRWAPVAAGGLFILALLLVVIGQPTTEVRWQAIAQERQLLLDQRRVQIEPLELLDLIHNKRLKVVMLDIRDERYFNIFHIQDSSHIPLKQLESEVNRLHLEPANSIFVVIGNDETFATEAWKLLQAESIPNAYILEGGINEWLNEFASESFKALNRITDRKDEQMEFWFQAATGAQHPAAEPNPVAVEEGFTPKVELKIKRAPASGGCG